MAAALERRFETAQEPRDLTLVYAAGQGDRGQHGRNHIARPGLVKQMIGGHWNLAPRLGRLALANQIEACNLPQGAIMVLLREIAAKRPGVFTKAGLDPFINPRHGGGSLNQRTTEPLVERTNLDGETWLRHCAFPVHVGLIRATSADWRGHLTLEREGLISEVLPIAPAARTHGGIVIAQGERIVDWNADPKAVRVPGVLVGYLVVAANEGHPQTFGTPFDAEWLDITRDRALPAPSVAGGAVRTFSTPFPGPAVL